MTIKERKHMVMLWKLNKLKDIPVFVQSELSRQADGENKAAKKKKEKERAEALKEKTEAGTSPSKKFSINMDAFISSIAKGDYDGKFNGKMQKSVKNMEMQHHKKLMVKKGHKPLFDTPDYLKQF